MLDGDEVSYKHSDVTYPFDTTISVLPKIRAKEMEIIKESHFENLVKTKNYPTAKEARIALMMSYCDLVNVWIEQHVRLDVGTCYESKRSDMINCISTIVVWYDSQTNQESSANGVMGLENAYDFFNW